MSGLGEKANGPHVSACPGRCSHQQQHRHSFSQCRGRKSGVRVQVDLAPGRPPSFSGLLPPDEGAHRTPKVTTLTTCHLQRPRLPTHCGCGLNVNFGGAQTFSPWHLTMKVLAVFTDCPVTCPCESLACFHEVTYALAGWVVQSGCDANFLSVMCVTNTRFAFKGRLFINTKFFILT